VNGTKIPYRVFGNKASSTNPSHWSSFDEVRKAYDPAKYAGIGYVFAEDDPYVGIDLDDCRDPTSGVIADWAHEILLDLNTYAEVSPSGTGVKAILRGSLPIENSGRKFQFGTGQVECYQHSRYFAITGDAVTDEPIAANQAAISRLWGSLANPPKVTSPDITETERCRLALAEVPDSISGQRGHDRMLEACCVILRHGIDGDEAQELIREFNSARCDPPWSQREIDHKWKSAKAKVMRGNEFGVVAKKAGAGFSLELVDHVDFMQERIDQRFVIDQMVVAHQHFIIGGPSKCFKTSVLLDLGVSAAYGGAFLGKFSTPSPQNVLVISGESGRSTIQRTLERIQSTKPEIELSRGKFYLGFKLPQLSLEAHLAEVRREIEQHKIGLCIIDPAYLCVTPRGKSDIASNVFGMGPILAGFGEIGDATGCTMGLVHHTRKPGKGSEFKRPGINDLTQSGFMEWVRQWIMLAPRGPRRNGKSPLWLVAGGSAGHGGEWELDIDEGDPGITGRIWSVELRDADPSEEAEMANSVDADEVDCQRLLSVILDSPGISMNGIRRAMNMSRPEQVERLLLRLGAAVREEKQKYGRQTNRKFFVESCLL
jgi:hypothetical protein